MDFVKEKLKKLQIEIAQCTGDNERMVSLIKDYQETQKLRNTIAKELGNEIII